MPYSLRCFPHDDGVFAEAARTAIATYARMTRHDADGIPEGIAEALRERYPGVVVRRASELAALAPDETILYVYRDGAALPR